MPERLNGAVLKTVVRLARTVGSNPTLSAKTQKAPSRGFFVLGEGMGFRTLFDQSA